MIVRTLDGLGYICWIIGEYETTRQHHEEMLLFSREVGDERGIASSLASLGIASYGLKDYSKSKEFLLASLTAYKKIGHTWGIADRLGELGELALAVGEFAQAAQFAQESNTLFTSIAGEPHSWGLRVSGNAALAMGDGEAARRYFYQALHQAQKAGRWGHALLTLVGIAQFLAKENEDDFAFELLVLVMSHRASWQMGKDQAHSIMDELEARLPPDVAVTARKRGLSRTLETTIQELLTILKSE